MGSLRRFGLRAIAESTGINTLIETGTGLGGSVEWSLRCGFGEVFSVELEPKLYAQSVSKFANKPNVHLREGDSVAFLRTLGTMRSRPKLIFLDAHFAGGADFGLSSYNVSQQAPKSFPLLEEVRALQEVFGPNDVLIVDDARMYQPGLFQLGECPDFARRWHDMDKLEALFEFWSDTHFMSTLDHDHGYFVLAPIAYEEMLPKWLNLLPHDGDLQQFTCHQGIPGVTSISILRRVHDARFATRYFVGDGLDIGGGMDSLALCREFFPLIKHLFVYDQNHGDAQLLQNVPDDSFDFAYSSHCLEHLRNPVEALENWLRVIRPGGALVVQVPDEDLYEQGTWPSRFNSDHKMTFTIGKSSSWSPVSVNVLELINQFVGRAEPLSVALMDHGYRYGLRDGSFDQTRTPAAESAIEFVLRKRAQS